jgi:hypothetical protein
MTSIWLTLKQLLALSHVHQMPTHLVPFSGEKMGYLAPLLTTQNPSQLHWTLSTVRNPSTVKELVNCIGICQLYRNLSCTGPCQPYRTLSIIHDCQQQHTGPCRLYTEPCQLGRKARQLCSTLVNSTGNIVTEHETSSTTVCRKTFGI